MQNHLSQPKTKLLNSSRRNISKGQPSHPLTRLKSHHQAQREENATSSIKAVKPRSSLGKRPVSAKRTQTVNSNATTSSVKSQTEVKGLINSSFVHNPKVKEFLRENRLNQTEIREKLINNELFTLSLVTCIANRQAEEINGAIQQGIISKIKRMLIFEQQIENCESIQNRIQDMIQRRLKILQK